MQEVSSTAPAESAGAVTTGSDLLPNQAVDDGNDVLARQRHVGDVTGTPPQHLFSVPSDASKRAIGGPVSQQTTSALGVVLCALFGCCGSLLELHSRASAAANRAHNASLTGMRKRKQADDSDSPDNLTDALARQPSVADRDGLAQAGKVDQGADAEVMADDSDSKSSVSDVAMEQEDEGTAVEEDGPAALGEGSQGSLEEDVREESEDQGSGTEEEERSTEVQKQDCPQGPVISHLQGHVAHLNRMLCQPWSFQNQQEGVNVGSRCDHGTRNCLLHLCGVAGACQEDQATILCPH